MSITIVVAIIIIIAIVIIFSFPSKKKDTTTEQLKNSFSQGCTSCKMRMSRPPQPIFDNPNNPKIDIKYRISSESPIISLIRNSNKMPIAPIGALVNK